MKIDIRQRKFRLALLILVVGMLVACAWYGFQALMGNDYPYNTFLFLARARFSDFSNPLLKAIHPNPYLQPDSPYPPAAYVLLRPFIWMPLNLLIFLLLGILPTICLLFHIMRPVYLAFTRSILGRWFTARNPHFQQLHDFIVDNISGLLLTLLLLLTCEPFLMCLDRGSNELWVVFMVGLSLYYFNKGRFYVSIAWLILPICMKIYPCVLLVLFIRRKCFRYIFIAIAVSLVVTLLSYACFAGDIISNYELNRRQLAINADTYILSHWGLGQTASAWNLYRSIAITGYSIQHGMFFDPWWNWYPLIPRFAYDLQVYSRCVMGVAVFVTAYCVLIEKDVLRRVVVLLLFMVIASPSGAEHKVTHIGTALIAFILLRTWRRGDYIVLALLAFTLIPKKEYLFECFGPTDSGVADISSAVVFNPLAMLSALGVLCWFGMRQYDAKWTNRRMKSLLPAWIRKPYRLTWR